MPLQPPPGRGTRELSAVAAPPAQLLSPPFLPPRGIWPFPGAPGAAFAPGPCSHTPRASSRCICRGNSGGARGSYRPRSPCRGTGLGPTKAPPQICAQPDISRASERAPNSRRHRTGDKLRTRFGSKPTQLLADLPLGTSEVPAARCFGDTACQTSPGEDRPCQPLVALQSPSPAGSRCSS